MAVDSRARQRESGLLTLTLCVRESDSSKQYSFGRSLHEREMISYFDESIRTWRWPSIAANQILTH